MCAPMKPVAPVTRTVLISISGISLLVWSFEFYLFDVVGGWSETVWWRCID
jgi:hypothetical protein